MEEGKEVYLKSLTGQLQPADGADCAARGHPTEAGFSALSAPSAALLNQFDLDRADAALDLNANLRAAIATMSVHAAVAFE